MSPTDETIRDWLKLLGTLNVGAMDHREFTTRLNVLVPALADRFDPAAFTQQSAYHVAANCTHFPTFGEIVPLLAAWWREHAPPLVAIERTDRHATTDDPRDDWPDIHDPAYLRRKIRQLTAHPQGLFWGRILAGAVKRLAPELLGMLPPDYLTDTPAEPDHIQRRRQLPAAALAIYGPMKRETLNEQYQREGSRGPSTPTPERKPSQDGA